MKESIVYVYGLLDNEGNVYYVGRSTRPRDRLINHKTPAGLEKKMIVLDEFVDKEHYWIQYYLDKGYDLLNREFLPSEDWKVGDIITVTTGRKGRPKTR